MAGASYNPLTVQEQRTATPQPGARCTECGSLLRAKVWQLAGGLEFFHAYWCASATCYRYGVHTSVFRLGEPR